MRRKELVEVKNGCEDKVDVKPGPHRYQARWAGLDHVASRRRVSRPARTMHGGGQGSTPRAGSRGEKKQAVGGSGMGRGCRGQGAARAVQGAGGSKRE